VGGEKGKMTYQFRQRRHADGDWENAMCWERSFASDGIAREYAQNCANEDQKETRWNSSGSQQGHYLFPQRAEDAHLEEEREARINEIEMWRGARPDFGTAE